MQQNYCLGIECTAHTFGIAILSLDKTPKFLVNIKDLFTTEKGGLIPNEVAKHHKEIAPKLFEQALEQAKIKKEEIKFIALSNSPGLAPCLIEGMRFAKKLSLELEIPVVPINHCIAHQEIGEITGAKDAVLLYASGANTQIIAYEAGKYRIFGETLDLGIGNFIDTFARHAGLGFPGGPKIQEIAKKGTKLIDLGYTIKGMDVAFSGMLTKLQRMLDKKEESLEDLSFSLQETAFAILVEAAERALAHTGKKELVLGGGVACNSRLQEMCKIMCEERGAKSFCPERQYLVDNAAMIAYLGIKMFNAGVFFKHSELDKLDIAPRQRTDEVEVTWR
ncbi:tRNA (adenosine(37)-N6)-threonylcarbamoyltransferase complex transferase subunit TsaD [Candidatus Pacearchaeota archaeon]|nr:tRNA (adenosine(37)-N6)-threonylcarbamoyltransferase complex transferase subunit TsaD [Candidatus Pacearchaeota archaeon]